MYNRHTHTHTHTHTHNHTHTYTAQAQKKDRQTSAYLAIQDHNAVIKVMVFHGGGAIQFCKRRLYPKKIWRYYEKDRVVHVMITVSKSLQVCKRQPFLPRVLIKEVELESV